MLPGKYPVVIDVAISHDSYIGMMDRKENWRKNQDARGQLDRIWGVKTTMIPVVFKSIWACDAQAGGVAPADHTNCSANIC